MLTTCVRTVDYKCEACNKPGSEKRPIVEIERVFRSRSTDLIVVHLDCLEKMILQSKQGIAE